MKTYTNSFFNQSEGTSEKNNNLGPMRIYSFLDNNEVGKNKIILLRPKCNNLVLKHLFRGGQHGTKSPGYKKERTLPPLFLQFFIRNCQHGTKSPYSEGDQVSFETNLVSRACCFYIYSPSKACYVDGEEDSSFVIFEIEFIIIIQSIKFKLKECVSFAFFFAFRFRT